MDKSNLTPYLQGYHSDGVGNPFSANSSESNQFEDGKRIRARHDAKGIEFRPEIKAPGQEQKFEGAQNKASQSTIATQNRPNDGGQAKPVNP